jgi:hypothetical protein
MVAFVKFLALAVTNVIKEADEDEGDNPWLGMETVVLELVMDGVMAS